MLNVGSILLMLLLWTGQSDERAPYVREGDRIEAQFQAYREQLSRFSIALRALVQQQPAAAQIPPLQDAPPVPVVYGYGVLPRIVEPPVPAIEPVAVFSYSWPITEGYIAGETIKLSRAEDELREIANVIEAEKLAVIASLVKQYRALTGNQATIDQYIQYNRFWQRSIAADRPHFDTLTRLYDLMKAGDPDTAALIREVLGTPDVPPYIEITEPSPNRIVLRVPIYTDIEDKDFLEKGKAAIEEMWQVRGDESSYAIEMEFRQITAKEVYSDAGPPERGARFDMRSHATRFPKDGAVLTTGAPTTHSLVGRYIALASGSLSTRTLAHEFGHVLGFRDGYIRGYRDLAEQGFEILELTSVFDDIMTAPRQGNVQPAHFKLIIEALKAK